MENLFRPLVAEISLENFRYNIRALRKLNGEANFFCPMIKANAYGHGDYQLAKVLEDEEVKCAGVALLEEGIRLREAGINKLDLLVFMPILTQEQASALIKYQLTPVISSMASLNVLSKSELRNLKPVHLKFNTGMSRLGFSVQDVSSLRSKINSSFGIKVAGICSHLMASEDWGGKRSLTQMQLERFAHVVDSLSLDDSQIHLFNSAGLLASRFISESKYKNWGSRPGISIYGIRQKLDFAGKTAKKNWHQFELRPVMKLKSQFVAVQKLQPGDRVSYGGLYKVKKSASIGVLPCGYADGYSRRMTQTGEVLFGGRRHRVAGTVCMDFIMVDIGSRFHKTELVMNGEVVLMGQQGKEVITADDMAEKIGTIPYEIFTSISARVPRIYL